MTTTLRPPAVAGTFYSADPARLEREVRGLLAASEPPTHPLLACIAPHAGYLYSGGVAGRLFGHLELPPTVLVLGPNHTGLGARIALAPQDGWVTPLGEVAVDHELRDRLATHLPGSARDDRAHWREHSIEVMLPFLALHRPGIQVVPICLAHLGLEQCLELGRAVAAVVSGGDIGIVASSDMSHHVSDNTARRLDHLALAPALELDPNGLYDTVHREGITMCGVVPATVALAAAIQLGATGAHIVAYATSGDVTHDRTAVVGYAGVCIHSSERCGAD